MHQERTTPAVGERTEDPGDVGRICTKGRDPEGGKPCGDLDGAAKTDEDGTPLEFPSRRAAFSVWSGAGGVGIRRWAGRLDRVTLQMEKKLTLLQTVFTAGVFSAVSFWYGFMFGRESARKELGDLIEDLRRGSSGGDGETAAPY